ncbi:uncharacterized protein C8Q71DRAFT_340874 [Rhodofomes roseus]|uniref:BED-type domain-containing protein n=1 Tax=Rhodofomes roseus TaxID=34475 RepID=A0ABQ8KS37_9APHY|nr:uncharacterized protein C8Q71DRAFT_340874 [Rhodofomes roseus]KAH9841623.1 hypothetical protein C8Q71DRAFT_340874 [Rhodofomes roseus]
MPADCTCGDPLDCRCRVSSASSSFLSQPSYTTQSQGTLPPQHFQQFHSPPGYPPSSGYPQNYVHPYAAHQGTGPTAAVTDGGAPFYAYPGYGYHAFPPPPPFPPQATSYVPFPQVPPDSSGPPPAAATNTKSKGTRGGTSTRKRKSTTTATNDVNKRTCTMNVAPESSATLGPGTAASSSNVDGSQVRTATHCGVGPVDGGLESSEPSAEGSASSWSLGNIGPTAVNSPLTTFGLNSRKRDDTNSATATDVWFFCRELKVNARPETKPENEQPLHQKPKTEFIGCRLCEYPKWQTWRNTNGITTTVRRHLERMHGDLYGPTVKTLGLKHANDHQHSKSGKVDEAEVFSVGEWVKKLVRFIVVDDQAISLVDCPEFRELLLFGPGPDKLTDTDIPHRDKLKDEIVKMYREIYSRIVLDAQVSSDLHSVL